MQNLKVASTQLAHLGHILTSPHLYDQRANLVSKLEILRDEFWRRRGEFRLSGEITMIRSTGSSDWGNHLPLRWGLLYTWLACAMLRGCRPGRQQGRSGAQRWAGGEI